MSQQLRIIQAVCPHDCPDTCSMSVTIDTQSGRAIALKGDKSHPFTKGFLCAKVNHYLERVYHPERLLYPMKRVGAKGEGRFERIGWDEAIDTVVSRLRRVADPQAILPYSYSGTLGKIQGQGLDRRFFHQLGASLLDRTICATAGVAGCDVTLGTRAMIDPEAVIHSRLIINWGSNTSVTNMHLWAIMHQARKRGAKIITIDPHRSKTAEKSDQWIAIRPGTDAALALGIMHILFRENWIDADYLNNYCLGTDELKQRVLREYDPQRVAAITHIDVDTIETLAADYGQAWQRFGGPAFIRLNYGMQRHGGGAMAVRTVTCLPAITGDWRHPGGGALLSTSRAQPFDDAALERPDLIPPGTRTINMVQLAEALAGELPGPPIQALFVYCANPASVTPNQGKIINGLKRDDLFTVVHEQFLTDTARYADIVLPATTQLEQFDLHNAYGHLYIQANPPAIAPLGEAKSNTDLFRLLAKAMNFEPELFDVSDEELAAQVLNPKPGNVLPTRDAFDGITLETLQQGGAIRLNVPKDWAPFAQGGFGTPSGKCEFFSPRQQALGKDPLPHYIAPHEDPQTQPERAALYPLQMISPPAPSFLNSTFINVDAMRHAAVEPTIEMHPVDAEKRGITDKTMVRIFNDRGTFQARTLLGETVRPGVVATFGTWWSRYTVDGNNCNATTSTALTDMGGGATFFDNLVQVERIAEAG